MLESQQKFAQFFGSMLKEKNEEIDKLQASKAQKLDDLESWTDREKSQLRQDLSQLKEEACYMQQLNAAQAQTLAEAQISEKVVTGSWDYNSSVALHHPNNVKRAKDQRRQQPTWTSIEALVQCGGGLPMRKQQYELGLPTPRKTEETSLLITTADCAPQSTAKIPREALGLWGGGAPRSAGFERKSKYERGNGNFTRTRRPISMVQVPRSARNVQEIEREMMLPTTAYKVPPNTAVSVNEGYRVPPYAAKEKRKEVLGQIEEAIEKEHDLQEVIDRGAGERQWEPGPGGAKFGVSEGLAEEFLVEGEQSMTMSEHEHLSERCANKSVSGWEGGW
jgi:hypothetical protein